MGRGNYRLLSLFVFLTLLSGCGGGTSTTPPPKRRTPDVQLTVAVTGNGTVTSTPAGISCPSSCTANFPSGTSVTLTATAAAGSNFGSYGGACSGSSCTLVLTNNQSVTATF